MKILALHNYYQQWGGEDESTEQAIRLLRANGHQVETYTRHNDEIKAYTAWQRFGLAVEPTWSMRSYRGVRSLIREFQPDLVTLDNHFPLLSPAVIHAVYQARLPLIYTLHNFRLLCPIGIFHRAGQICTECMDNGLWRSVLHGCYHGSRLGTLSAAFSIQAHRWLGTWQDKVTAFIVLSEFQRQIVIRGGLPEQKIYLRPNFLDVDPGSGTAERGYALFLGRLEPEKGVQTLLAAWRSLPEIPLKIAGDGALRPAVESALSQADLSHVEYLGRVPLAQVLQLLKGALFLVMPSEWYETFGRTIMEAYATGTPVLASNLGAMADLVSDGRTGLLFEPGNPTDLANKARHLFVNQKQRQEWGQNARQEYLAKYSRAAAYRSIMQIFARVLNRPELESDIEEKK